MTLQDISLDDAIGHSFPSIILYGDAGVGKTLACATLPGEIRILSAEGGLRTLKQLPPEMRARIRVTDVATSDDLRAAHDKIKDGSWKCDWLVLDSISEMASQFLREYKTKTKDARRAYGQVEDDIVDVLIAFKKLQKCGVVFIAKEHVIQRKVSEDVEIDYYGLLMPGKRLTTEVPHQFDEVWRMTIKAGKRVVITKNDGRSRAKSRGALEPTENVDGGLAEIVAKLQEMGE